MNTTWHGTRSESEELIKSIAHNCSCEFGLMGVRLTICAAHNMWISDQRALNGLLFARYLATRLIRDEWRP